ncbi:uncharacterized protein EV422DRAFT_504445 [Fimicolochytrium jonesii]|uniref:uncharacterized protein n=1 Tax=Fimicolochytrium jonesii TaxID=1396493 RepID=UPI0022FDC7F9|nr:uncharacterized protein EV422DRAFT_504445 [Fimicolochytrium jonesii]KAI8824449.1 hypothetical protein EV422DRAFT_504445 [Fimicolochytrium jonesii]
MSRRSQRRSATKGTSSYREPSDLSDDSEEMDTQQVDRQVKVTKRKRKVVSDPSSDESDTGADEQKQYVRPKPRRTAATPRKRAKSAQALPAPTPTAHSEPLHEPEPTFVSSVKVLELMRVCYTGARAGDVLEGTNPVTKGALLRVCRAQILPMKRKLDQVRAEPALWRAFLRQLGTLDFFSGMSEAGRAAWLEANELSKERMGSEDDEELDQLRFQVLGLGTSVLGTKVSAEDVEKLMEPQPREWQAVDIARMIPANTESNSTTESGRHTLFFIKSWWKISTDAQVVGAFGGRTIDIAAGTFSFDGGSNVVPQTQLYLLEGLPADGAPVAFRVPVGAPATLTLEGLTESHIIPLWLTLDDKRARSLDAYQVRSLVQTVGQALAGYAPSALRSLLQKLIRFPSRVCTDFVIPTPTENDLEVRDLKEEVVENKPKNDAVAVGVDSRIVLLTACSILLGKPMTFNPDIGRQVSGMESFLKRLAVILFEDSSFDDDGATVLSLLAGAMMTQRVRSWRPTSDLLMQWFRAALTAYASPLCFRYDIPAGEAMPAWTLGAGTTKLQASSALLDTLRSFSGDLAMVRYIASEVDARTLRFTIRGHCESGASSWNSKLASGWHGFESLPIYHHCDQHAFPNIGYYYSVGVVERECKRASPGQPYAPLFKRLFEQVTGANPRRTILEEASFNDDPFVRETRLAQRRLVLSAFSPLGPMRPEVPNISHDFTFELDQSWLPGLVGAIELKGRAKNARKGTQARPALLVTLCCDDPSELMVIRKPARGLKADEAALSDEIESEAVEEARQLLSAGVPLKATRAPSTNFKGCTAMWDAERNDYWIVSQSGRGARRVLWQEARRLKLQVPVHPSVPYTMEGALLSQGPGIQEGAMEALKELVAKAPSLAVLSRVLYYLETYDHDVRLNRIARNGNGMEYQVNINDTAAFRWLLRFSLLFPGALRPAARHLAAFIVPNGPLIWYAVAHLRTLVLDRRLGELKDTRKQHPATAAARGVVADWKPDTWAAPFAPWLHQTEALNDMIGKLNAGRRGHYLHSPMGSGKTLIVSMYLQHLAVNGLLPEHVIWSLPPPAVDSVAQELKSFGFAVHWMMPTKNNKSKALPDGVVRQTDVKNLARFAITIVLHDDLKRMADELRQASDDLFLVMDEAHMALDETQRTTIAREIAKLSLGFVALSGTPTKDNRIYKLIPWISLVVPFAVNERNFWAACNSLVSQIVDTGVHVRTHEIEAPWSSPEEEHRYRSLVPEKYGGVNNYSSRQDASRAATLCYDACTREMARLAVELLYGKLEFGNDAKWRGGVFLVANDEVHQEELTKLVIRVSRGRAKTSAAASKTNARDLADADIFCITGRASIHMSDTAVNDKKVRDYPVVITTKRRSTGYTLSRLKVSITSVYPSNLATRLQLDGRLNRLSQLAKELDYYTVHAGILSYILHNHQHAASIDKAFKDMGVYIAGPTI